MVDVGGTWTSCSASHGVIILREALTGLHASLETSLVWGSLWACHSACGSCGIWLNGCSHLRAYALACQITGTCYWIVQQEPLVRAALSSLSIKSMSPDSAICCSLLTTTNQPINQSTDQSMDRSVLQAAGAALSGNRKALSWDLYFKVIF